MKTAAGIVRFNEEINFFFSKEQFFVIKKEKQIRGIDLEFTLIKKISVSCETAIKEQWKKTNYTINEH